MVKLLHIAVDEKFINTANWLFEKSLPNQNHFIIIKPNDATKIKHVDVKDNVEVIVRSSKSLYKLMDTFDNYDLIVLHGMPYNHARLVLKYKGKSKFYWLIWGKEVYNNPYVHKENIYGDKTMQSGIVKEKFVENFKSNFRKLLFPIKYQTPAPWKAISKAIKKVDFVGILHKEDFDFFKSRNYINQKAEYLQCSYFPIDYLFKDNADILANGNNILLGNSATPTNNHLEVFELLKDISLGDRKIITPLSYGGKEYANEIISEGNKLFPNNFSPLVDFMQLREYNSYIQQCGIVILNNYRQQALGNTMAMLWMGAKLYLDDRNTIYKYLKRIGVKVYSIKEDLVATNKDVFKLLSQEEIDSNRAILLKENSSDIIAERIKVQIESVIK